MIINHIPLSWYTSRLASGTPFAITKHSDASLYCMQGKPGGDCNGCDYTPELRQGLLDSISYQGDGFYHGVQRLTDRDNEAFDQLLLDKAIYGRVWIDTGILASQFVDGGLFPLIQTLRALPRVVIVANALICGNIRRILGNAYTFHTPNSNTYNDAERIKALVGVDGMENRGQVYLFSCGMAACALIPQCHRANPTCSYIDVGHLWDALLGNKIRHYQRDLTQDHIDRNLRAPR